MLLIDPDFDDEVYLTLEAYDQKLSRILFDFADFKSFSTFGKLLNLLDLNEKAPSMVLFSNFKVDKKFKDGVYYKINREGLIKFRDRFIPHEDSSVIGYDVDMRKGSLNELLNGSGKPSGTEYTDSLSIERFDGATNLKIDYGEHTQLIVRHVRQGSWNEFLFNDEPKVVFDMGTAYFEKKIFVKNLVAQRDSDYQKSRPNLILSHWDIDHYHMLLEAEDETIKSFSSFIYRARIPNQTSDRVLSRFKSLNPTAIFGVSPFSASPKKSSERLIPFGKVRNGLQLYNGSENKSRNKSGLTLCFHNQNLTVVCGADLDYSQLDNFILPNYDPKHDHYLVVPHHGGLAGKLVYNTDNLTSKDAIISVGPNNYGHPLFEVKEFLKGKKFQIANLQCRSHYILNLT